MINKSRCHLAVDDNTLLSSEDKKRYHKMCDDGLSIAELFRQEIPKHGTCSVQDALNYIKEEEEQMSTGDHFDAPYHMDDISVAEHVLNEDLMEPEHAHQMYSPVSGDVKFFQEWLEGHHPSIGCMFGSPNQVPSDDYYRELEVACVEAAMYRNRNAGGFIYAIPSRG
jgi:hypothetical protein